MEIKEISINELREYENNPRNNENAVEAVAASIKEFGWKVPIVIDADNVIVAGHTRLKAARLLGLDKVPCIVADDLTPEQVKAFRIADNKTNELAEWDFELLESELAELAAMDFDMKQFGFDENGNEEEFDENDLDGEKATETVLITINCGSYSKYESIKEKIDNIAQEIGATVAVKMT